MKVLFPGEREALNVHESQAAVLVADGLARPTETGGSLVAVATRGEILARMDDPAVGVCDFCSDQPTVVEFPTRDYAVTVPGTTVLLIESGWEHFNLGAWMACSECARLIRAGRRDELADRSAAKFGFPARLFRMIHDEFWANREGEGRDL